MTEGCWAPSFQHKHIQSIVTEVEFKSLSRRGTPEGCSWPVVLTQSRRFSLFVSLCFLWACTTGEDANHPAPPPPPPAAQQGTVTPAQPPTAQPESPPPVLADTEVPKPTASVPDLKLVPAPDLSGLDPARAEHLKAAYQSLQAAIARKDLSPQELSEAYGMMAQLYHTYHLLDAAQICYENVGQLAPQNFAWRYARADILRRQGKVADALADYEAACKSQPKNIPCLIHQGRAHLDNHNTAKAGELFTHALALDPQAAAAHEGLGYVARAQEHYQEAAQHFEAALVLVPAANRLHDELATLYQHLNDSEKAQVHLEQRGTVGIKVVDALTEQLEALVRGERIATFLGRLAFYAGHYDEAATQFTKAVEADPRNATARVNLATMLVQIGKSPTAITQLQEALRLQPAFGGAHYNLAVLLLQQPQRLPDAIYHFRAALVADPTDRHLYGCNWRTPCNGRERETKRLSDAMKAADLDPTDEKVLLGTAALPCATRLFRRSPSTPRRRPPTVSQAWSDRACVGAPAGDLP